jgi:hypothetical protein
LNTPLCSTLYPTDAEATADEAGMSNIIQKLQSPWHGGSALQVPSNLRGHYGFLTDYSAMDEATARDRIRWMATTYGIREFHFYDWFAGYSKPIDASGTWKDAWNTSNGTPARDIYLDTIKIYIDEIHRQNGRAWAYIQTVMADEPNLDSIPGIYRLVGGNGEWIHQGAVPCYFRNAALADHQCDVWVSTVHKLGFDGIHWDTLGANAGDYEAETAGTHEYLVRAKSNLARLNLLQILNFSGPNPSHTAPAWWDPNLVTSGVIAFPFFEVFKMEYEKLCYAAMADPALANASPFPIWGVLAFYPYYDRPHYPDGTPWFEVDVLLARWFFAPKNRLVYEAVGDGHRRLQNEYLPYNFTMSPTLEAWMTHEPPPAPPTLSWW